MDRNKQFTINMVAAALAFIVNVGINFLLSPYIVESVGVEAFGFWGLANNFINYAAIITIALNSMAGRFFAIEVQRGNWDAANQYFSSIFFANLGTLILLLVPSAFFILRINSFIHVPQNLVGDVQLLFGFIFLNFFIGMLALAFSLAPFAHNIVYLRSLRQIEGLIIKSGLLLFLFLLFKPRLWFLGIAVTAMVLYETAFGFYYTKKLLPEIRLERSNCTSRKVRELVSSGSWNVLNHVGRLLATGFDLLIANLFLGPTAMGVLALSKTIPTFIESLVATMASVFSPEFTMLYARNEKAELEKAIRRSIKILGMLVNIPIAILVAFGPAFFRLWVPSQDARLLQTLSVIAVFAFVFAGATNSFFSLFIVTNRVKANSLLVLLTGILNVAIVLVLLKFTELGLLAIAGISTILITVRNLAFTVPYGAICIGLPWPTFFPEVGKSVAGFAMVSIIGLAVRNAASLDSWLTLALATGITALVGFILNLYVLLNPRERSRFFDLVKKGLMFRS